MDIETSLYENVFGYWSRSGLNVLIAALKMWGKFVDKFKSSFKKLLQ